MHLPNQLANLWFTLDNLVLGLLVSQGELLQLGSCHDWMLPTEFGSYSHGRVQELKVGKHVAVLLTLKRL